MTKEDHGKVTVEDPSPELDDRGQELEHQLRAALADLDNLRKRFEREVARERQDERARVAAAWLPVIDDLDRALEHLESSTEGIDAVSDGVRVVRDHALTVLARMAFPRFTGVGDPFDPARHEAVGTLPSDQPPGTVVEVLRPGYGTVDLVLRPAAVLVAEPAR